MKKQTTSGTRSACRLARLAITCCLLLSASAARAEGLKIENVTVAPRDAEAAIVKFDIAWANSWRHGSFHDAVWVFFKLQPDSKAGWQPVRLVADKVVNPAGFSQEKGGTPLEFVVPGGDDGFVGMFVRRAADGTGALEKGAITAVWDFTANKGVKKDVKNMRMQAFGIEMVYVAEGPFDLGSGGTEWNRFYTWTEGSRDIAPRRIGATGWVEQDDGQDTPPYRVTSAGAIPTGRQEGKLWAAGIRPEDGGEIPASFPNGYAAFYCMKHFVTQGQYAGFLNTLTPTQAKERFYIDGHGRWIKRSGKSPNHTYSASEPDERCPWLSWTDGAAFAAWAGLRPMTELEYEKAIRGPIDAGVSYWGVAGMNMGGVYERPVSVGSPVARAFAGTHGGGTPDLPADWPADVGGAVFRGDYLTNLGQHLNTSGRAGAINVRADRNIHPFAGWRAVRSAPAGDEAARPLTGGVNLRGARLARLDRPVRADGLLDEWDNPLATLSDPADLFPVHCRFAPFDYYGRLVRPWQGPRDLSARVYLGSDGEALCMAAEVTDDRHFNAKTGDSIAGGDALQIGLVTAEGVDWNITLALTQAGVALHQSSGEGETLMKTADCAVVRDDKAKVTRYELRLPLAALGLKPGDKFGFNVVFVDDDGDGQPYWLRLAPGLPGSGNSTVYPQFVLEK